MSTLKPVIMFHHCTTKHVCVILTSIFLIAYFSLIYRIMFAEERRAPFCSELVPDQLYLQGSDFSKPKHSVTFVIREFEEFENDVVNTAVNLSSDENLVLIIADRVPYPPLNFTATNNIRLVSLDTKLSVPLLKSRPESYISLSKFVFIVPDAVRMSGDPQEAVRFLEQCSEKDPSVAIVAFPVHNEDVKSRLRCLDLQVDTKRWTLSYTLNPNSHVCDALDNNKFVLFMRTEIFLNLSSPLLRPTGTALFVQSAFRGLKVAVDQRNVISFHLGSLFEGRPHNHWKHKQRELERLQHAYSELGVKLVKRARGQEDWFGCGKETGRCFGTVVNDMPEYLYYGRWTPPCCLRALRETARHVFRMLERDGVRYWLEGGSLLGAARNGDIIPWDYDVDIGIYRDDISNSELLSYCQHNDKATVDDSGFVWEKATEGDFYRVQYSQLNHLHVDIFPFYSKNGTMTKDTWFQTHRQDTEFPESFLKPLTRIHFAGMEASAPNNVRTFLEYKFGLGAIENYRLPNSEVINGVT